MTLVQSILHHLRHNAPADADAPRGPVLVLDDRPEIIDLFREAGRDLRIRVQGASSVEEAIEHLSDGRLAESLSAAVLDLFVGDASGLDVYHRLRALRPDLPITLMTGGDGHRELIPVIVNDTHTAFLAKPFTGSDAAAIMRNPAARCGRISELLDRTAALHLSADRG